MKRLITVAASVALAGCGYRFGHRNEQTSIFVKTEPARLAYFVLDRSEAEKVLLAGPDGLKVGRPAEFQQLLNRQLQGLISDTSELTYAVGGYILAVHCPAGFRFQQLDARPGVKNETKVSCT
jgi:hypothetical protein